MAFLGSDTLKVDVTTYSEITFKELSEMKISHGDLYWKKASGKFLKVLNTGDVVDHDKISKFEKVAPCLFIDQKSNEEFVNGGSEILLELLSETQEFKRIELIDSFISHLHDVYWSGEKEALLFDLVLIFKRAFYNLDEEFESKMDLHAFSFYQRSMVSSAIITLCSICAGYTNGTLLKDLYNTCYYFDYSYALDSFSTEDLLKVEAARSSHIPLSIETEHVASSLEAFSYQYEHTNFKKLISFHHERLSGDGAYVKCNQEEIGDIEKIVLWCESVIPFGDDGLIFTPGAKYLSELFTLESNNIRTVEKKLLRKLSSAFSNQIKNEECVA